MESTYPSNTLLIDVNRSLETALSSYLDPSVSIRFDLPDPSNLSVDPIVSVFLYDIYEDLEMRAGVARTYKDGALLPSKVNICCNYLITYWASGESFSSDGPSGAPDNQAMMVMNQALNALVNNQQLPEIPGAYTRIIPPKNEGLYSLGSFWQSLGNKPRLLLNFTVTVPITLRDKNVVIAPVSSSEIVMENILPNNT